MKRKIVFYLTSRLCNGGVQTSLPAYIPGDLAKPRKYRTWISRNFVSMTYPRGLRIQFGEDTVLHAAHTARQEKGLLEYGYIFCLKESSYKQTMN